MTKLQIQELKKKHGTLKEIKVDGKQLILRQPTIAEYAMFQQTVASGNYINAVYTLGQALTVHGEEHLKDDKKFLNIAGHIVDSVDIITGEIEENGNQYTYTTEDGKKAVFNQMSRKNLNDYQLFQHNSNNSVRAGQNLGEALFVSGDKEIVTETKYLLGVYTLFPTMIKPLDTSLGKL